MIVSSTIYKVIEKWRREGINLLPPKEEAVVISTLNKIGRNISRDVIGLYCATGGMDDDTDEFLWTLWPLGRVVSENSNYERPYILFADYLINSYCYCFKYESEEKSSVCVDYFNGEEPQRVARTISEFFDLYLTDPEKVEIWDLPSRRIR